MEDAIEDIFTDSYAERRDALRADVALMRELGVSRWGDIEIGPPPSPMRALSQLADESTQPRLSPEQQALRDAQERRRITLAASGGPVKLGGASR